MNSMYRDFSFFLDGEVFSGIQKVSIRQTKDGTKGKIQYLKLSREQEETFKGLMGESRRLQIDGIAEAPAKPCRMFDATVAFDKSESFGIDLKGPACKANLGFIVVEEHEVK